MSMEFSPYSREYMSRETAQTLKILGHPDRIALLTELLRRGPLTTSELAVAMSLKQPDLSGHLTKLTEHGVIYRAGRQRSPHELVQPLAIVSALWGASELAQLRYNDPDAARLAREMLKTQLSLRDGRQSRRR